MGYAALNEAGAAHYSGEVTRVLDQVAARLDLPGTELD